MKRRSFLKKGLIGGAILALGGAGLFFYPTKHVAEPTRPLKVLDDRAFQVLVAIARRVVTVQGADPIAIAEKVDESLLATPPEARADLNKLLGLFESALSGLVFDGRPRPFTRLDGAAQDRVLEQWRDSSVTLRRGGYQALRKLCLAGHYGNEASWKGIHYPGPPNTGGFINDDSKAGTPEWLAAQGGDAK